MSCTSTGGVATWGRINGLGIAPVNLEPVGTLSRRGDDMYSATSPVVTVTLGEQVRNGTIYSCHAGNEASEDNHIARCHDFSIGFLSLSFIHTVH